MTLLNYSQLLLSTSNSKLFAFFNKQDTTVSISREISRFFIVKLFAGCIDDFLSQKYGEQFL